MKITMLKHLFMNSIHKVLGVILVLLGIAGLFLPFLQGVLLILLGLALLGNQYAKRKLLLIKGHAKRWWGKIGSKR